MNAVAFGKINPFGAKLNAIYSSDIGHFDVIDMRDPLPEAYELVEDGYITEDNFRDFVFEQCGAAMGHTEPALLRGHERGQGSGRGIAGGAAARLSGRREVSSGQQGRRPSPRRRPSPLKSGSATAGPCARRSSRRCSCG